MRLKLLILALLFSIHVQAQELQDTSNIDISYQGAFNELNDMLTGNNPVDFKRAVFITENAYMDDILDYDDFLNTINNYTSLAKLAIKSRDLQYDGKDKEKISIYAVVFSIMQDTTKIMYDSLILAHPPFTYDFDDCFGKGNWEKMFLTKLLETQKGNCHSLPILYKILVEELGEKAYLSLAPNHLYIKLQSKKLGWYNTELTSGIFPIDAWLMASGYIHLAAIQNGIYMDTLSQKQSIALCMVDLAQGYQRKFNTSDEFVLNCCNTALEYYPNFINALLLKAETLLQSDEKDLQDLKILYQKIHNLGFRKMPEKMYLEWLVSLKEEKAKYQNKKINFK